jgi:hypothetical protein
MERLHQVILSVLAGCIVLGVPAISAQDTCSLAVRVLSPDGHRIWVPVTVHEKNGRIIEKDQEDKDVYFCDLGILPVEVKVGSDGMCNRTMIRDVPVFADRTYLLNVAYDPKACPEVVPPPVPTCSIMFRISDSAAKWVPHARVSISSPIKVQQEADSYGRVQLLAKRDSRVQGSVEADGFKGKTFAFRCSKFQLIREENIHLSPR